MSSQQSEMSFNDGGGMPPWAEVMKSFFSGDHQLFAALRMEPNKVDKDVVSVFATIPDFFAYKDGESSAHPGAYTIISKQFSQETIVSPKRNSARFRHLPNEIR